MSIDEVFQVDFIGSRDTSTHRVCSVCGELKSVDDFYKDGKDSHGNVRYRRDCKDCYKTQRYLELKRKESKK
jgi:hypothetical protein